MEKLGYNTYQFYCDRCESNEIINNDFIGSVNNIKKLGWKIANNQGEFMHFCPNCNPIRF